LYRSKKDPKAGHPNFIIPANVSGGAQWPLGIKPSNYMLLFEPERDWDCTDTTKPSDNWMYDECVYVTDASSESDAKQIAKQQVEAKLDRLYEAERLLGGGLKRTTGDPVIADSPCSSPSASALKQTYDLTLKTYSYRLGSRV